VGPDDLGAQFTEIFIKKADNVGLLLSLLEVKMSFFDVLVYSGIFLL